MDKSDSSKLTINTHNVNGFNRSKEFLYELCDTQPNSIRAIQEHWLAPPYKRQQGVNRLRALHPDFDGYGQSAMTKDITSQVRRGHPYGGTGFLYNKKYCNSLKPLLKYSHERVSVMQLSSDIGDIILISGYLPYFNF